MSTIQVIGVIARDQEDFVLITENDKVLKMEYNVNEFQAADIIRSVGKDTELIHMSYTTAKKRFKL